MGICGNLCLLCGTQLCNTRTPKRQVFGPKKVDKAPEYGGQTITQTVWTCAASRMGWGRGCPTSSLTLSSRRTRSDCSPSHSMNCFAKCCEPSTSRDSSPTGWAHFCGRGGPAGHQTGGGRGGGWHGLLAYSLGSHHTPRMQDSLNDNKAKGDGPRDAAMDSRHGMALGSKPGRLGVRSSNFTHNSERGLIGGKRRRSLLLRFALLCAHVTL